ncbi:MAG: hypothetical protein IJ209_03525 [Bacteroidaceae bacterium]|nr:hypothetical protein [Bacteroidaceae bacterium]
MKQKYFSPSLDICELLTKESLLEPSIIVGGTVDNENDIGFVKGDRGGTNRGAGSVWDDDWSTQ